MDTDLASLTQIPLEEILQAQERLKGKVIRTPLIPLDWNDPDHEDTKVWLKLENLQHTGSFKMRGACNAIQCLPKEQLKEGIYTSSAGNFAQGLAWNAKEMSVPCTIIVPHNAPLTKIVAIRRYGGDVISRHYDIWWQIMKSHYWSEVKGKFIHPSCDRNVLAGNGTIGLEILEDLPEVNKIIMPYGGGGLSTGVASAVRQQKPDVKNIVCELSSAAPLTTSLAAGEPSSVKNHQPSFVDGMGGKSLFPEMWNLVKSVIDDTVILSLKEISDSVAFLLQRSRILAEGAGAASVAAVTNGHVKGGNIVCVISGGNIDPNKLVEILKGNVPQ